MFSARRFATLVYGLTVFTIGYFAAATVHDLWTQADRMNRTVVVMGYDTLTPSAGGQF